MKIDSKYYLIYDKYDYEGCFIDIYGYIPTKKGESYEVYDVTLSGHATAIGHMLRNELLIYLEEWCNENCPRFEDIED